MSGISIMRGDCWTELMLTAFADGRDGSHLQEPYAGLSVKTANGAADLVFKTVEAGTVQQDKLVVQNSGSGTATLRGLRTFCIFASAVPSSAISSSPFSSILWVDFGSGWRLMAQPRLSAAVDYGSQPDL